MRLVLLLIVLVVASACSGGSAHPIPGPTVTVTDPAATSSPSETSTAAKPAAPSSASAIVRQLVKLNSSHDRRSIVYTAKNDPNHLLGRPDEYSSKATFIDERTPGLDRTLHSDLGSVSAGGSLEYFATDREARTRALYIHSFGTIGSEYDYIDQGALLRISTDLLPSQAKRYERQFSQIMHHAATGPIS
jgi:hypothetical protein